MPKFQYRFEGADNGWDRYVIDMPDAGMATTTAKFATRYLAARQIAQGALDLSGTVVLEDAGGTALERWRVADFVSVT